LRWCPAKYELAAFWSCVQRSLLFSLWCADRACSANGSLAWTSSKAASHAAAHPRKLLRQVVDKIFFSGSRYSAIHAGLFCSDELGLGGWRCADRGRVDRGRCPGADFGSRARACAWFTVRCVGRFSGCALGPPQKQIQEFVGSICLP
jgi:hypothetical protein